VRNSDGDVNVPDANEHERSGKFLASRPGSGLPSDFGRPYSIGRTVGGLPDDQRRPATSVAERPRRASPNDQKGRRGSKSPLLPVVFDFDRMNRSRIEIQVYRMPRPTDRFSGRVVGYRFTLNGWAEKTDGQKLDLAGQGCTCTNAGRFAIGNSRRASAGRHFITARLGFKLFKAIAGCTLPDERSISFPSRTVTLTARVDGRAGQTGERALRHCDLWKTVRDSDH